MKQGKQEKMEGHMKAEYGMKMAAKGKKKNKKEQIKVGKKIQKEGSAEYAKGVAKEMEGKDLLLRVQHANGLSACGLCTCPWPLAQGRWPMRGHL